MKKKILLIIAILLSIYNNHSQQLPRVVVPSPNATSIERYSYLPVNLAMGTVDVSILVYSIKTSGIEIPLKLRYDTSGVRVSQESSWVGLGWSLEAGGIITRTVIGKDDFGLNGFIGRRPDFEGENDDDESLSLSDESLKSRTKFEPFAKGRWDGEPDMFSINFLGHSGKFYFPHNPKQGMKDYIVPIFEKETNLDIKYYTKDRKWEIRDIKGNIFYFNSYSSTTHRHKNESGKPSNIPDFIPRDPWVSGTFDPITSWYLDKITTYRKENIYFDYSQNCRIKGITSLSEEYAFLIASLNRQGYNSTSLYKGYSSMILNDIPPKYRFFTLSRSDSNERYLKKIRFSGGEVILHSSKRKDLKGLNLSQIKPQKLDAIEVKDYHNSRVFKCEFKTSYFHEKYREDNPDHLRLKLDSLIIKSNNNSKPKKYQFEYTSGNLPNKNSNGIDYWGYYNGHENHLEYGEELSSNSYSAIGTRVPSVRRKLYKTQSSIEPYAIIKGADRNVDSIKCKYATLKKIIFPTGGTKEFLYGSNRYSYPNPSEELINEKISYLSIQHGESVSRKELFFDLKFSQEIKLSYNFHHSITNFERNDGYCSYYLPKGGIIARLYDSNNNLIKTYQESSGNKKGCSPNKNSGILRLTKDHLLHLKKGRYKIILYNVDSNDVENEQSVKVAYHQNKRVVTEKLGGGLRIEKIITTTEKGVENTRVFNYVDKKGKSSGVLIAEIENFREREIITPIIRIATNSSVIIGNGFPPVSETCLWCSSNGYMASYISLNPYSVGYSRVEETSLSSNSNEKGKIVSHFFMIPESIDNKTEVSNMPISPNLLNGTISKKEYFDKRNFLLREENYLYTGTLLNKIKGVRTYIPYNPYLKLGTVNSHLFNMNELNYQARVTHNPPHVRFYFRKNVWVKKERLSIIDYYPKNISKRQDFFYNYNKDNLLVNEKITANSNDKSLIEKFLYAKEKHHTELLKSYRIGDVLEVQKFKNNLLIFKENSIYTRFGNQYLPKFLQTLKGKPSETNKLEDRIVYHDYDDKGNLTEVSKKDGTHIVYIWGYNKTQPIAKIENATLGEVGESTIANLQNISNLDNDRSVDSISQNGTIHYQGKEGALREALQTLRVSLKDAQVTSYTYDPLIGVTSITDPRGETIYYHYDDFNRLQYVKDKDGNILKEHKYNYKN